MRTKKKGNGLLGLVFASAFLYSAVLIVLLVFLATSGFARLEEGHGREDLRRIARSIALSGTTLKATARDYANWTDAYRFVTGKLPSFVRDAFGPDSLSGLGLSFAACYDGEGRLLAAWTAPGGVQPPVSIGAADRLSSPSDPAVIRIVGGRPCLVAGEPITTTDGLSPPVGVFVLGRELGAGYLSSLGSVLGLELTPAAPTPATLGYDPSLLGPEDDYVSRETGTNRLLGYLLLRDSRNAPVLVVRSEEPGLVDREVRDIGIAILLAASLVLVLFAAACFLSLRVLLLGPLARLERILATIKPGETGDEIDGALAALVGRYGAVGRLAAQIAEIGGRARKSAEAVAYVKARLEQEVEARTSELRRANHKLRIYRKIMEGTSEGVVMTDLDSTIREVNDAFCRAAGYPREELVGRKPRMLKSDRHDPSFYEAMWKSIRETGQWSGEIWDRRRSGEVYPKWLSINTIYDDEGAPESYVGLSADITRIKQAEEQLSRMVFYDSLTGLPNRALFRDRFAQSLLRAQRSAARCALLFMDLDRFKNVNDSLGHLAGDELLVQVSRRLLAEVRESDTVCRLGGDEFTVILDEVSRSEAAGDVAAKIIRAVRMPYIIAGTEVYVGASIGIALFPFDGMDEDTLIKKADAAMYEAKEAGRGQHRFAAGLAGEDSRRRLEVEGELRRALENKKFRLHYQPQVTAGAAKPGSNDGLMGAEALLRLERDDGSIVGPGSFIEVAEDSGLIPVIGEWALREACREASRWKAAGKRLIVSVNVSARQFERGDLVSCVKSALEASGLDPKLLKLEVTESLFMRNMERAILDMNAIKELGVTFAVDDFGIGFSSLQYLQRLPLDYLKIDKVFVDDLTDEFEGGEVATACISLARAFGMSAIAEGVETVQQLAALKRRGCDEFQGYLISRPLDPEAFMKFAFAPTDVTVLEDE